MTNKITPGGVNQTPGAVDAPTAGYPGLQHIRHKQNRNDLAAATSALVHSGAGAMASRITSRLGAEFAAIALGTGSAVQGKPGLAERLAAATIRYGAENNVFAHEQWPAVRANLEERTLKGYQQMRNASSGSAAENKSGSGRTEAQRFHLLNKLDGTSKS